MERAIVRNVTLGHGPSLEDEAVIDGQAALVPRFLERAGQAAARLDGRRVWMVSSTATGGGVAEMLPVTCALLRRARLDVRWLVLEPHDARFFVVTKALHHLLHGRDPGVRLDAGAADLYERVSRDAAASLAEHVESGDVVVVHDPQPCALPRFLPHEDQVSALWRCHIGVPVHNEHVEAAWRFLAPHLGPYRTLIFSSERYIPAALEARANVLHPAIDATSHKNRELSLYKLLGVLRCAGLVDNHGPSWAAFEARAQRYVDGHFESTPPPGLLSRPVLVHISRFDPLKGFGLSMAAFAKLVESGAEHARQMRAASDRTHFDLERCALVLAGPDPSGVQDDPEAERVLLELCRQRDALPAEIAARVHILKLPMHNVKQNALMVNALQRLASVVLQPSLQEGFGLTVSEAMWKRVPIVATNVGGIAHQVRSGIDGILVEPGDPDALAQAMLEQLVFVKNAERMALAGRARVAEHFLSLREALQWVELIDPT